MTAKFAVAVNAVLVVTDYFSKVCHKALLPHLFGNVYNLKTFFNCLIWVTNKRTNFVIYLNIFLPYDTDHFI